MPKYKLKEVDKFTDLISTILKSKPFAKSDNILIGDDANYYAACTSAIPITKTHRGRGGTSLKADIDKHRKVKIQ